jgi:hypothetical protein
LDEEDLSGPITIKVAQPHIPLQRKLRRVRLFQERTKILAPQLPAMTIEDHKRGGLDAIAHRATVPKARPQAHPQEPLPAQFFRALYRGCHRTRSHIDDAPPNVMNRKNASLPLSSHHRDKTGRPECAKAA